jgi:UMF1 family MFS transporter
MYDWANSAFATIVLAAVLPTYYSEVAGANLASPARATAYWSAGLSISLLIIAVAAPILGALSDVVRIKKGMLGLFMAVGTIATAALALVSTGDWFLASVIFVVARIGWGLSNMFYDSLLPHVAVETDQDRVSTLGYSFGYIGGGLALIVGVALIFLLPETNNWGVRSSFVFVAIWWAIFSLPLLRRIPEPPIATARQQGDPGVVRLSFTRLGSTFKNIRHYKQLTLFLFAFLLFEDGIGTIIAVSVIYATELGFGAIDSILALVLVQFVAVPFALAFGVIPRRGSAMRNRVLAFVLFNLVALPVVANVAARVADDELVGKRGEAYAATAGFLGEGTYAPTEGTQTGDWTVVPASDLTDYDVTESYNVSTSEGDEIEIGFNGTELTVFHSQGPAHGVWTALIDGEPVLRDSEPILVDGYNPSPRFGVALTLSAEEAGEHTLVLRNTGNASASSNGDAMGFGKFVVEPPPRVSNLVWILGLLAATQIVGLALSAVGGGFLTNLSETMDVKRTIMLGIFGYMLITVWGFFLDSVVEFWFLAFMVAVVQGGTQSLSRSLYSSMSPASQSGEFFGFFASVSRFAAVIGPAIFAVTATVFDSSRPAVLSLLVLFLLGALILRRVDVEEGQRLARTMDLSALRFPRHVEGGLPDYGRTRADEVPETPDSEKVTP